MSEAKPNLCTMCHKAEGSDRYGTFYDAVSESGMRLLHFWVCNDCAIPLGPGQGGVVGRDAQD